MEIGSLHKISYTLVKNPNVKLNIEANSSNFILQKLYDRTISVGIINEKISDPYYKHIRLFADPIVLVSSSSHSIYNLYKEKGIIQLDDLSRFVIINLNHEIRYYKPILDLFKIHHIYPPQIISVNNIEAMKQLTIHGMGISFLPKMTVRKELVENRLVEIPFAHEKNLVRHTYLIYPNEKVSSIVNDFVYFLCTYISTRNSK